MLFIILAISTIIFVTILANFIDYENKKVPKFNGEYAVIRPTSLNLFFGLLFIVPITILMINTAIHYINEPETGLGFILYAEILFSILFFAVATLIIRFFTEKVLFSNDKIIQKSLFKKDKIIYFDQLENINFFDDRGKNIILVSGNTKIYISTYSKSINHLLKFIKIKKGDEFKKKIDIYFKINKISE